MNKVLLFEKTNSHPIYPPSTHIQLDDIFRFDYINLEYIIKDYLFITDDIYHIDVPISTKIDTKFIQNTIDSNITTNVVALNFSSLSNSNEYSLNEYVNDLLTLCKNNPKILFIFFYMELDVSIHHNLIPDNAFFILNTFQYTDNNHNKLDTYYSLNWSLQFNKNNFYNVIKRSYEFRRYKKYNFYNGCHKPIRLFCYKIIKENNMLDDGYFSYLDYAQQLDTECESFINLLGMGDEDNYKKFLNTLEIPYMLDNYKNDDDISTLHPLWGSFPPFMNPILYSSNSYINITTETNSFISTQNDISISEKTYKPFISCNIPLIVGQPGIYPYLRDCGFDMFDDFFDNSPCTTQSDMLNQIEFNFKKIKNITMKDLHEFYIANLHRINHNFNIITFKLYDDFANNIYNQLNFLKLL